MYNFHKVRALELNTDIGYIPEKSNKKTGNGLKIFSCKKIPVGKSYTTRILKPHTKDIKPRPAYFPKIIPILDLLTITYPSAYAEYFNLEHLLTNSRMVENLTPTYSISCVLSYRKIKVISDWLLEKAGYPTEV